MPNEFINTHVVIFADGKRIAGRDTLGRIQE